MTVEQLTARYLNAFRATEFMDHDGKSAHLDALWDYDVEQYGQDMVLTAWQAAAKEYEA